MKTMSLTFLHTTSGAENSSADPMSNENDKPGL